MKRYILKINDPNHEGEATLSEPGTSDRIKVQFGKMASKFVREGWIIDNGEGSEEDTPRITLHHKDKQPVTLWIEEATTVSIHKK